MLWSLVIPNNKDNAPCGPLIITQCHYAHLFVLVKIVLPEILLLNLTVSVVCITNRGEFT